MEKLTLNPLEIYQILKKILVYISPNTTNLISARAVCQSWNEIVNVLLHEKNICVNINPENIQEYQSLLMTRKMEIKINPSVQLQPHNQLKLKMSIKTSEFNSEYMNQVINFVSSCRDESWASKLTSLTIFVGNHNNNTGLESFMNLMQLVSSNLTYLQFKYDELAFGAAESTTTTNPNLNLESQEYPQFPNLASFSYDLECTRHPVYDETFPSTQFILNLLKSAPNLTSLSLTESNLEQTSSKAEFIVALFNSECFTTSTTKSLQELELPIYNESSLYALTRCEGFPKLKLLRLHQHTSVMLQRGFGNWLANACPTLSNLDLAFLDGSGVTGSDLQANFPVMPKITKFGAYGFPTYVWHHLSGKFLTSFALATSSFPSLNSVSMDLTSVTVLAKHLKLPNLGLSLNLGQFNGSIIAPNVETLILKLNLIQGRIYDDATMHLGSCLQGVFPKLRKLVLKLPPLRDPVNKNLFEHAGLLSILNMNGITSLEIENYGYDWLGELLIGMDLVNNLTQNLQVLKLGHSKIQFNNNNNNNNMGWQCLDRILIGFSSLKLLQIPAKLLTSNKNVPYELSMSNLADVKLKYSKTQIQIL